MAGMGGMRNLIDSFHDSQALNSFAYNHAARSTAALPLAPAEEQFLAAFERPNNISAWRSQALTESRTASLMVPHRRRVVGCSIGQLISIRNLHRRRQRPR